MSEETQEPVNTPAWLSGPALSVWNGSLSLQRVLLIITGLAVTLLVGLQVFTRYVLGISILGIEDLACFAAVWMYFIGSAHGAWERGHISASLVDIIAPHGRLNAGVNAFAAILTVIIAGWMTVWAWDYFMFSLKRGSVSRDTGIILAWVHIIMPICLALMTLYWTVEATSKVRYFLTGGYNK